MAHGLPQRQHRSMRTHLHWQGELFCEKAVGLGEAMGMPVAQGLT
jgi:hypothetical protein